MIRCRKSAGVLRSSSVLPLGINHPFSLVITCLLSVLTLRDLVEIAGASLLRLMSHIVRDICLTESTQCPSGLVEGIANADTRLDR